MNPSIIAPTPELFAIWTLICEMTHDSFKWYISFSSFVVLSFAQTQRSIPNVHAQTEQNQGASHLRCAPDYRNNDITVFIMGNPNNRVILCPQSSLKFSHTHTKFLWIYSFIHLEHGVSEHHHCLRFPLDTPFQNPQWSAQKMSYASFTWICWPFGAC